LYTYLLTSSIGHRRRATSPSGNQGSDAELLPTTPKAEKEESDQGDKDLVMMDDPQIELDINTRRDS
jgi:hypothetical protein